MADASYILPERTKLEDNIDRLLGLLSQEENLELEAEIDRKNINLYLDQAFNPEKFEIVFAGRLGLESLLSNNKNGDKDNTIHALLKAQFEENFQDLFSIDNTNKLDNIRESILSVFTRQLRIKDCKLGTKEEVIDLEEKLDLGNVIKTKLELDLSQEIQNRQQQKANRIKRLNAKIDHYLQLKQEIQSCFQLPQTNCQLPEVKKII